MKNSDVMKHYINPSQAWNGQCLDVVLDNRHFVFELVHATLNEPALHVKCPSEHVHDVYHVVLCVQGDNRSRVLGNTIAMVPGTLVVISPGEGHSFTTLSPSRCLYHEMTFKLTHVAEPLTAPLNDYLQVLFGIPKVRIPQPCIVNSRTTDSLSRRFARILDCLRSDSENMDASMEILGTLLDLAQLFSPDVESAPMAERRMSRVKHYLDKNFAANDTVEDLAQMACLSRGHFLREFRKAYDVPPIKYRLRLRMEAAKSFLLTSNLQCKEISDRLGFGDEFHFSRTFKSTTGVAPTAFRQNAVDQRENGKVAGWHRNQVGALPQTPLKERTP